MTCAEHLIEIAIHHLENGESYEDFVSKEYTKANLEYVDISPEDVWSMAVHVVYTFKSNWVSDTIAVLRGETPFDLSMREYVEKFL